MTTTAHSPTGSGSVSASTVRRAARIHAVTLHPRTMVTLAIVSLISVAAFGWPLLAAPTSDAVAHSGDAPLVFALLLPLLIAVVWAEIADGLIDTKALAVLDAVVERCDAAAGSCQKEGDWTTRERASTDAPRCYIERPPSTSIVRALK